MKRIYLLTLLAALIACEIPTSAKPARWVPTWATPVQLTEPGNMPPAPGLSDATLREIVHVSIGGDKIRVRFSNEFGSAPLTIIAAHVAIPVAKGSIAPASDKALSFDGRQGVTIAPGKAALSDPLDYPIAALSDLALTLRVQDSSTKITGHPGSRSTSYLTAGDAIGAASLPAATQTAHWYYISEIDIPASDKSAVIVTLGDSITDGRGSTTDGNDRWPDLLNKRLHDDPNMAGSVTAINVGIGGNAVIRGGLGETALKRLDRDVLSRNGAKWVIVFEGINDIGAKHPPTAAQMIEAYKEIAARAHAKGIKVIGATITPCGGSGYFSPEMEAIRQDINAWVRNSGGVYDGVADFDAAVRDPLIPSRLQAQADCSDHLHLTPVGYQKLADSIDFSLFQKGK